MAMIRNVVRALATLVIAVTAALGFVTVRFYAGDTSDAGVQLVYLLYDYESITEVSSRMTQLESLCSPEVYTQLNIENEVHYASAYGRAGSCPVNVMVVFDRPGLVVYALDSALVYPKDLWCLEYSVVNGKFAEVREYKLAGWRTDTEGGLF